MNSNEENIKCDECGKDMILGLSNHTFTLNGKPLELKGIETYKCTNCNNEIVNDIEFKMIENLINATQNQPNIDVLNLDETASLLRVTNQTIYNMIKAGKLKAYKIGREWRFLKADILAFMNASSSETIFATAAKGGQVDKDDFEKLRQMVAKRNND